MVQTIPAADLGRQMQSGSPVRLIDVRSPAEFAAGHAVGAVSIPLDVLDARLVKALPGQGPLFVICRTGGRSERACRELVGQQLGQDLISVAGGTEAWASAGLPMVVPSPGEPLESEADSPRVSVPMDEAIANRVRVIAGSLALLGMLLGYLVHPALHALSGAIGLGLLQAGLSGKCLMGTALGRLARA